MIEPLSFYLVREIVARNVRHRNGGLPQEWSLAEIVKHLYGEVNELDDAIVEFQERADRVTGFSGWDEAHDAALKHACQEVADVYDITLHLAHRLGMTFAALDAEGCRKMRERFVGDASTPGAQSIPEPDGIVPWEVAAPQDEVVPAEWLRPPDSLWQLARVVREASSVSTYRGSPKDEARDHLTKIAALRFANYFGG